MANISLLLFLTFSSLWRWLGRRRPTFTLRGIISSEHCAHFFQHLLSWTLNEFYVALSLLNMGQNLGDIFSSEHRTNSRQHHLIWTTYNEQILCSNIYLNIENIMIGIISLEHCTNSAWHYLFWTLQKLYVVLPNLNIEQTIRGFISSEHRTHSMKKSWNYLLNSAIHYRQYILILRPTY